MKLFAAIALVIQTVIISGYGRTIPDSLASLVCPKSSKDYAKCLFKSYEKSRGILRTGIKELNFPSSDPFTIPKLLVSYQLSEDFKLNATFTSVELIGFSNLIFDNLTANIETLVGQVWVTIPQMQGKGEYDVNAEIFGLPIHLKGLFNGSLKNIKYYGTGHFQLLNNNGFEYWDMDSYNNTMSIGTGKIKLTSSNDDTRDVTGFAENFINTNFKSLFELTNSIFTEYMAEFYKDTINSRMAVIPAKELLPE